MRILKIYTIIIECLFNLSFSIAKYFESKYSELINRQITEVNKRKYNEVKSN